ncbi:MAG: hypothetical protein ACRDTE_11870 [Pseudonocardiaceae bacterium]
MRLEKLAKDGDSHISGCQTVYLGEAGPCVVQGELVDAGTYANLDNVLPGEAAVFIKPEILVEAVRRYQDRSA